MPVYVYMCPDYSVFAEVHLHNCPDLTHIYSHYFLINKGLELNFSGYIPFDTWIFMHYIHYEMLKPLSLVEYDFSSPVLRKKTFKVIKTFIHR